MYIINMPPHAPALMESTRSIGYSLESAIADIIDNSITAHATECKIFYFPTEGEYIYFLDNGIGMNNEEINTAMQYGSKTQSHRRDNFDLGRFGLGLKTASLSQCKTLTVISKQGNMVEGRRWDLDHVIQESTWSLLALNKEEIEDVRGARSLLNQEQGTLVVWENLDRLKAGDANFVLSLGHKMDIARAHLELVFHRYLAGEKGLTKLTIELNNVPLKARDPFLIKKSTQIMDDEDIMIEGEKITIRPFILPHISKMTKVERDSLRGKEGLNKEQGFYVYRNKRLIIWGTWFRLMRKDGLHKLARIMVDIPNSLDHLWTLDIKKSSATPPEEIKKVLQAVVLQVGEKSKRTWTYRGRKEISDNTIQLWTRLKTAEQGVLYTLNREHPLIEQISNKDPEVKGKLDLLLKHIEGSIPLNQLYVDMNSDEKVGENPRLSDIEIEQALTSMLLTMPTREMRKKFLELMRYTEPFCNFSNIISDLENKEGSVYDL